MSPPEFAVVPRKVIEVDPRGVAGEIETLGVLPPDPWSLPPALRNIPPRRLHPHLYPAPPRGDIADLGIALRRFGADQPEKWIRAMNPEFHRSPFGPHGVNCADASISYATTRQTGVPTAAAGYTGMGNPQAPNTNFQLYTWAGTQPRNFVAAPTVADIPRFQQYAWGRVASQLDGKPPGTVGIVHIEWAPTHVNGHWVRGPEHFFNIEVTPKGLRWVDAQSGFYEPWPPKYHSPIVSAQSIYRVRADLPWSAE